jgi:hypothetical protein
MNNFAQYIDKCRIFNMHLCYAEWLTFQIVYFKNVGEKFDCLMALEKLVILFIASNAVTDVRLLSGVARICILRVLGARIGASGRAGSGSGRGDPLPEGGSGVSPRENFRNVTILMFILDTENFTFVLHVHS